MPLYNTIGGGSPAQKKPQATPQAAPSITTTPPKIDYSLLNSLNAKNFSVVEEMRNKSAENKPYDYNKNVIKLKSGKFNGTTVPIQLVKDAVESAKRTGTDVWNLLALIGQESTFGGGNTELSKQRRESKQSLVSGWNLDEKFKPKSLDLILADRKVPGINLEKDFHGWYASLSDDSKVNEWLDKNPSLAKSIYEKISSFRPKEGLNYFDLAAERIAKKGIKNYNPGDPNYEKMVLNSKELLLKDKDFVELVKSLGG